jgi:hypothetical protein
LQIVQKRLLPFLIVCLLVTSLAGFVAVWSAETSLGASRLMDRFGHRHDSGTDPEFSRPVHSPHFCIHSTAIGPIESRPLLDLVLFSDESLLVTDECDAVAPNIFCRLRAPPETV